MSRRILTLKPQDIVIVLKIVALRRQGVEHWTYKSLADTLHISEAEIHQGLLRAKNARLVDMNLTPLSVALQEFIVHGVKYVFPPTRGSLTRGLPTSYLALPLCDLIVGPSEPGPVWPDPEGTTKGWELLPLYPTVPKAARKDAILYELLALTDALREGRARERGLAQDLLKERLTW